MPVPATREVVSNLLLVVPQQSVKRQDIGVIDKRQAMVTRIWNVDVRGNLSEKPGNICKVV